MCRARFSTNGHVQPFVYADLVQRSTALQAAAKEKTVRTYTRTSLITLAVVALATSALAQDKKALFVTPTPDGFHVYLEAALVKKEVPVRIVTTAEHADFVLTASAVEDHQQSGASKIARCLFAYCAGIEDSGNTSVQLLKGDEVVWSYSVNKGRGQKNRQSLAEAIAKHLKGDYLERQRAEGTK
jgi:hypothetical protein